MPDQWDFYQGQCTSWVAYRLNQLNGIAFTPALGSIAWYLSGHVKYVGKAVYYAWTEILPAAQDVLSQKLMNRATNNATTAKSYSTTVSYSTPGLSAEVIHERPLIDQKVIDLAKTDNVNFHNIATADDRASFDHDFKAIGDPFKDSKLYRLFMVARSGSKEIIASPSVLRQGDCFAVAYGKDFPSAPTKCKQ